MTREEAMEIIDKMPLCNECDSSNFPYTCVECGDAFMLAMEALKQPEIVRCKDCHYGIRNSKEDIFCIKAIYNDKYKRPAWYCADGERKE